VLLVRFLDVALLVLAAPIVLLVGVSTSGYLIAAGAWIALRGVGVLIDRGAGVVPEPGRELGLRLGFMLGRLFLLALTIILVRKGEGRDAGLTALLVIVFAFTVQLGTSAVTRPRRQRSR
jgi:hypothetical protein